MPKKNKTLEQVAQTTNTKDNLGQRQGLLGGGAGTTYGSNAEQGTGAKVGGVGSKQADFSHKMKAKAGAVKAWCGRFFSNSNSGSYNALAGANVETGNAGNQAGTESPKSP